MLYGRFIQSKTVDKVAPFLDPLKTLKLKKLASECVTKKDVTIVPLLIYYEELYMLHPLIRAKILKKLSESLKSNLHSVHPAFHCFTYCDTSSSFIGREILTSVSALQKY